MGHADPDGQIPAAPAQRLRLFELLAENAPDGIAVIRLDGTITYANPALQRMLRSDTSLVGLPAYDVLADPADRMARLINDVALHGSNAPGGDTTDAAQPLNTSFILPVVP